MNTWSDTMTLIVRTLINDLDESTPTYDDEKLQLLILTSAQLIKPEIDFNNTYTIDFARMTLSPDPISTYDDGFINLVSMKAALMILTGEVKDAATNSVKITDAAASIDNSSSYLAKKDLYQHMLDDFSRAKIQYSLGNLNAVRAILSPYGMGYSNYGVMPINNINFG